MTAADLCEAKAEIADDDRRDDAALRSSVELFRNFIAFIFWYYDIEECNGNDCSSILISSGFTRHDILRIFFLQNLPPTRFRFCSFVASRRRRQCVCGRRKMLALWFLPIRSSKSFEWQVASTQIICGGDFFRVAFGVGCPNSSVNYLGIML